MSKINILNNVKNKLKRFLAIVPVFCLLVMSSQINTYPHIPLKELFEVLKIDDIGFGHALLHSSWIENMYQYGPGKPHRQVTERKNRVQWKPEEKSDAVANLIRKFWFRRGEDLQLLPTQFGCLANIGHDQLGRIFGKLINCVYQGFSQENQEKLFDELMKYDPEYKQYREKLTALTLDVITEGYQLEYGRFALCRVQEERFKKEAERIGKQYEMLEMKREIAQASKEWGKKKGFSKEKKKIESKYDVAGYRKAFGLEKKKILGDIEKGILDEYSKIQVAVKKKENSIVRIVKKKREAIKKALFEPVQRALLLCKMGKKYAERTVEGILWALFFHKLDDLISMEEKIAAINDCLVQIDERFKKNSVGLKELYSKKEFEQFEQTVKCLSLDQQVKKIFGVYDIGLHYLIGLIAGRNFPPAVVEGRYGYEYEPGKISQYTADCHEAATLDIFSILWYNRKTNFFDNSYFTEKVIKNGEGFRRLSDALKYFYLADQKGIKASEYTCEYMAYVSDTKRQKARFTSLAKLKSLGKISQEEVDALDIKEVPPFYIARSEVRQEFMNMVSGRSDTIYCIGIHEQKERTKALELESDARNIVTIFNYFYGMKVEDISQLDDAIENIFSGLKSVSFEPQSFRNVPNRIKIQVSDFKTFSDFDMTLDINGAHTSLLVPGRKKTGADIFKKGFAKKVFERSMSHDLRDSTVFTLFASEQLLKDKKITWSLPALYLAYYSFAIKKPEIKLEIIQDILERHPEYYGDCRQMVHNLVDAIPDDRHLNGILHKIIMISGFYKRDSFFQEIIKKSTSEQVLADVIEHAGDKQQEQVIVVYKELLSTIKDINKFQPIIYALPKPEYKKIVALILERRDFAIAKNPNLFEAYILEEALNQGFVKLVLDVVNHKKYHFEEADKVLKKSLEKGCFDIAWAIVNHKKFVAEGPDIGAALSISLCQASLPSSELRAGFARDRQDERVEMVALKILEDPHFTDWGNALQFAHDRRWNDVLFTLVKHEKFNGNELWCNIVLELALKQGNIQGALEIIKSKNFNAGWAGEALALAFKMKEKEVVKRILTHHAFNSWDWAFICLLKEGCDDIILDLVKHERFDASNVCNALREALERGSLEVATAIMEHKEFSISSGGVSRILKASIRNGYLKIALQIIDHPTFDAGENEVDMADVLELVLHKGYMKVALSIIEHKTFTAGYAMRPLRVALEAFSQGKGDQYMDIFLKIIEHPTFDASSSSFGSSRVLKVALEKRYQKIALRIVRHTTFDAEGWWVEDFLEVLEIFAKRFDQKYPGRSQEIRDVIQIIRERQSKE